MKRSRDKDALAAWVDDRVRARRRAKFREWLTVLTICACVVALAYFLDRIIHP